MLTRGRVDVNTVGGDVESLLTNMAFRQRLRRWYFGVVGASGEAGRLRRSIQREGCVVVLNLHRISPHLNPYWSPLHPDLFEDLVAYLARTCLVTSFRELGDTRALDRPTVILSFDDGYYDFIEYALPILEKYRLPVNQNVIPLCVATGRPPWMVQLYDFLNTVGRSVIDELALPGFAGRLAGNDSHSKTMYGLALSAFLKQRSSEERQPLWASIEASMSRVDTIRWTRMMTAEDIGAIADRCEIGVHSFSHESMARETDQFFEADVAQCAAFFDEALRLPMDIYAFPNGSYRASQIDYLLIRGIRTVLVVDEQFASRSSRVFPRLTMYGSSRSEVRLRALGRAARGRRASRDSDNA